VGDRRDAMAGARLAAEGLGYRVEVMESATLGEARVAGERFARRAEHLARRAPGPACVIASGETTVRVLGRGRGGRNQEVAVGAAATLAAIGSPALVASIGTDGIDGPTDAAGGVADSATVARCAGRGLGSPAAWLAENDTYRLLEALGDLLTTGPTGTNVGDLQVALFA
jgi:glycerate-2-kinase